MQKRFGPVRAGIEVILLEAAGAMDSTSSYGIVITTTESEAEAERLARALCESKLAACVQLQQIKSFYVWKGEQCSAHEQLLLIKTRKELYPQLERFIRERHPYEQPEIILVPIEAGSAGYLNWIDESTNA